MKTNILFLIAIIALAFSCTNPVQFTPEVSETEGALQITLPGGSSRAATAEDLGIAGYQVSISCDAQSYSHSTAALPGETVVVDKLAPDTYAVSVNAYDADNVIFLSGETSVIVEAGKLATASISLSFETGNIDIQIALPELPDTGVVGPRRVITDIYRNVYTYNEDGFITRIDKKTDGDSHYEEFNVDPITGYRTGSTITTEDFEWVENGIGNWYMKFLGTFTETQYSTIELDAQNRESTISYYNSSDDTPAMQKAFEYSADSVKINYLSWNDIDGLWEGSSYKVYDNLGRLLEYCGSEYYDYWAYYQCNPDTETMKVTMEYYGNTAHIVKQTMFINDKIFSILEFDMKSPGVYSYGNMRDADGKIVQEIIPGSIFNWNAGGYAQSLVRYPKNTYPNDYSNYLGLPESAESITYLYDESFEYTGDTYATISYEAGEATTQYYMHN